LATIEKNLRSRGDLPLGGDRGKELHRNKNEGQAKIA